jgi:hypothetical protein
MTGRPSIRPLGVLVASALVVTTAHAQAPDPAKIASAYATHAQENAKLMRQYSWQERIQLTVKGEAKDPVLYQMNYDASGKLQKTEISAAEEDGGRKHGIKAHIKKEKIEEFKEWTGQLGDVLKRYIAPTPGEIMDFFSKATVGPGPGGSVQASGAGWAQAGDKVTFTIDPQAKRARSMSISTAVQGDPVTAQVKYAAIPDGPQYISELDVNAPSKQVQAEVTNFNYVKQP